MGLHSSGRNLGKAVFACVFCVLLLVLGACGESGEIVFTPSQMQAREKENAGMAGTSTAAGSTQEGNTQEGKVQGGNARKGNAQGDAVQKGDVQEADDAVSQQREGIYVHVCGAVLSPGVKLLPEGSRVVDALEAAGGFAPEADQAAVNLASILVDGQKIYFPTQEETKGQSEIWQSELRNAEMADDRIDINAASVRELQELPGIGSVKADAIVKYRNEHGKFEKLEELLEVPGISKNLYDRIKDMVKLTAQSRF